MSKTYRVEFDLSFMEVELVTAILAQARALNKGALIQERYFNRKTTPEAYNSPICTQGVVFVETESNAAFISIVVMTKRLNGVVVYA